MIKLIFLPVRLVRGDIDFEMEGEDLGSEDANGYTVFVCTRVMANKNLELNASLNRSKIEGDSNNSINLSASHYTNKEISLDAAYSFDSDTTTLSFGATKHF